MASRRIGRYVAAATATSVVVGSAYLMTRPSHRLSPLPVVPLEKDANGRIIPPRFPHTKSRLDHLQELQKHNSQSNSYDLLIIGGGATGTGIALDAATRGLKVALVERDDFSSGASSKSTKLVHGGVRYLEKAFWNLDYGQYALVREALRERATFLDIAPHLAKPLPILLPVYNWWQLPYFWAGTKAYDLLAWSQGMGLISSYALSRKSALETFPLLKKDNLTGALVYYDGQQNDSRMNVSLAMTASLYGATVLNHAEVTALEKDANGKICGAKIRDTIAGRNDSNEEHVVYAKGVINATGPFSDGIEKLDDPNRKDLVAPSSGVHIVLPGDFSREDMGVLQASSDGRVIFFLPWENRVIAGTTDSPCSIDAEPVAKEEEIGFILKEIRKFLTPEKSLSRDDVLAAWSGIRPLVRDPNAKNTESLVRNHLVVVSDSGLLTCAGGKWTTYRQMAEDAVDEAIKVFNLTPGASAPAPLPATSATDLDLHNPGACQTHHVRLVGAHGFTDNLPSQLATTFNLDRDIAESLAHNYGDRAWEVLSSGSNERLYASLPYIESEIRYSARHELAETAADVLARRMRMAFLDVQAALDTLPRVIDVLAEEHKWSAERKNVEWQKTVKFLGSMGLARELLGLTREEVVAGKHRERQWKGGEIAGAAAPSGSGKLPVGLPAASLAKMRADKLGKGEED